MGLFQISSFSAGKIVIYVMATFRRFRLDVEVMTRGRRPSVIKREAKRRQVAITYIGFRHVVCVGTFLERSLRFRPSAGTK